MPRTRLGWRHVIAASVAVLTVVGCTKPPTNTAPDNSPGPAPGQQVTVPVQPDTGLGNETNPSSALTPPLAAPLLPAAPLAAPVVAPLAPALPVVAPPALGLALGAPVPLIPFVSYINGDTKLFVYDRTIADNYALPGAGDGIQNPTIFSNSRIVFDRDGDIFFYDVVAELLVTFNDVNGLGYVARPSISFDGTVMTFLLDGPGPGLNGKALIWINGVVADLAKVNSVGALHGGITWIRISCDARWAVFTTGNGRLFVYDIVNPMVHEVTDAQDVAPGKATHPAISPDGTQIAFAKDGFIFRYDRIADLTDPMPFLNNAFNAEELADPLFLCWDNAHIYAELKTFDPWDRKVVRVVEYNWITETVAGLTILNNALGDGINLVSDPHP